MAISIGIINDIISYFMAYLHHKIYYFMCLLQIEPQKMRDEQKYYIDFENQKRITVRLGLAKELNSITLAAYIKQ